MDIKTLRRYFLFVVSLFVNAFGVAFITKALLGTSPITSITYVLSLFTRLTMGEWTIVINVLFVVTEPLFMNRRWLRKEWRLYLLQLPVTVFFGLSIDCSMGILSGLNPEAYFSQIAALLAGCVILAAGIALEVKMDVAMTPGEYYVRVIAMRFKKDFGYVKLGFDSTLVALSCLVSFRLREVGVRQHAGRALVLGIVDIHVRHLWRARGHGHCRAHCGSHCAFHQSPPVVP